MKTFWLLSTILIAQLATSSFAQVRVASPAPSPPPQTSQPQKPEEEDVVRITTNLVQVDAVVTDKSGKVVTDLKPEEMQISEDGKPQKITNFSYVVTETPAATNNAAKPPPTDKNAPPVPS